MSDVIVQLRMTGGADIELRMTSLIKKCFQ